MGPDWKRGIAQFRDTWILLDGDAVVVTLVVAQVFRDAGPNTSNAQTFKRRLKTFLFCKTYSIPIPSHLLAE